MIIQFNPIFDLPVVRSFLHAFEYSMISIVITDANPDGDGEKFLYANQTFLKQSGYDEQQLFGKTPRILQGPKTDKKLLQELKQTIYRQQTFIGQTINYRKNGSEYIVRWSINAIKDEQGEVIAFISCQTEVTEQVGDHQLSLILAEAINQTADAAMITDLQGNIVFSNRSYSLLTGYSQEELLGSNTRIFRSGQMPGHFYRKLWESLLKNEPFDGIFLNKHKDGHLYFEHKIITPILDEQRRAMYFLAISRDTTEQIHKTDSLAYQAFHDPLTGLYNRAKLDELAVYKVRDYIYTGKVFSLLIGDVDNFKQINDRFGHSVGDQVIQEVAESLVSSLRQDDIVVRWGGEEFCVLLDTDLESAYKVAETLRKEIAHHDFSGILDSDVSISFGIASILPDEDFQQLFARADQGLYQAKADGKNCVRAVRNL